MTKEYLWALVTLIIAVLLAIFLLSVVRDDESKSQSQVPVSKYDEHILELDKQSLERAYQAQLQLLFATWLRDDIHVTHRVENGLRIARRAYIFAADRIEKRAEELAKRK